MYNIESSKNSTWEPLRWSRAECYQVVFQSWVGNLSMWSIAAKIDQFDPIWSNLVFCAGNQFFSLAFSFNLLRCDSPAATVKLFSEVLHRAAHARPGSHLGSSKFHSDHRFTSPGFASHSETNHQSSVLWTELLSDVLAYTQYNMWILCELYWIQVHGRPEQADNHGSKMLHPEIIWCNLM